MKEERPVEKEQRVQCNRNINTDPRSEDQILFTLSILATCSELTIYQGVLSPISDFTFVGNSGKLGRL